MARLFVPIWQFAKRKISPIASKIYQIRFKISPNSLKLLKNPSKFCLSGEFFAKSGHEICPNASKNIP